MDHLAWRVSEKRGACAPAGRGSVLGNMISKRLFVCLFSYRARSRFPLSGMLRLCVKLLNRAVREKYISASFFGMQLSSMHRSLFLLVSALSVSRRWYH